MHLMNAISTKLESYQSDIVQNNEKFVVSSGFKTSGFKSSGFCTAALPIELSSQPGNPKKMRGRIPLDSRQRIFRCSQQCQININLVFHISEDGSETK